MGRRSSPDDDDLTPMELRSFGRTGLRVSVIGMGCSRLGSIWHGKSDRAGRAAVAKALDSGINLFDTADGYAFGRSEKLLGQALRSRRDDAVIVTKCGMLRTPLALTNALLAGHGAADSPRIKALLLTRRSYGSAYITRAADESLRRLHTDYLDVFMLHSPPREVLLNDEIPVALDQLRAKGKVRAWGVSAQSEAAAWTAMQMPRIDCLQIRFNVCQAKPKAELISRAANQGLAVIARQPFASGALLARAAEAGLQRESVLGACLQLAQDAEGVASVVVGMSRPEHVAENVAAARTDPTTPLDLERIRALCH